MVFCLHMHLLIRSGSQLQHCLENTNAENKEPDLFFPSAIYNLYTSVDITFLNPGLGCGVY